MDLVGLRFGRFWSGCEGMRLSVCAEVGEGLTRIDTDDTDKNG
jgi:hypothetical protein